MKTLKTLKKIKNDAENKNLGNPKIQFIIEFVTGPLVIDLGDCYLAQM